MRELAISSDCVPHGQLMALFGEEMVDEKTIKARIEVLVSRLCVKLRALGSEPLDIRVLRGQGYQLTFALSISGH